MKIEANTPEEYIDKLPDDRVATVKKLRSIILDNLPNGFYETINYGMIGYVVPKSIYPPGYHVNPDLPLPFMHLALQKNHIALYHSGLYADKKIHDWFLSEYVKTEKPKLDMGKSCLRFKNSENIPYDLISKLVQKMTIQDWINCYEKIIKKK